MKKIMVLICFFASLALNTSAQFFKHTTTSPTGVIVNAGRTDTLNIDVISSHNVQGVQMVLTRNSGTLSSGSMILSGTVDGSNYDNIDTLSISNVAVNKKTYKYVEPVYTKYRIVTTVVGSTSNVTPTAFLAGKKYY